MKIVLDTNLLLSGIFWKGTPKRLLDAWMEEKFTVVITEEILSEYSRVLQEFEKKRKDISGLAQSWVLFVAQNSLLVKAKKKVRICRDPFDDMFIDCAIAGKASYIVSGDNDLLSLKEYMGIEIVKATTFLSRLK